MAKYTIGLDYGTLSGRAVLVDIENGREVAWSMMEYPHAVMSESLPTGERLEHDWALQHPRDYLQVLYKIVPEVLEKSGVDPEDVIGLGADFTASTVMPVYADGTPLCFAEKYARHPHAYPKLWKHHGAGDQAVRITRQMEALHPALLQDLGGKISPESAIPKLLEVYEKAPEIYAEMDGWVEAGDWLVWMLTGCRTANACAAGFKALYAAGYPGDLFAALDPGFAGAGEKLCDRVVALGEKVGGLTEEMANKLGLKPGIAVSSCDVDGHACVPGAGVDGPGKMLMILGTSAALMLLDTEKKLVDGICGVVKDSMLPGLYGYEAGQSCMGDHYDWCVHTCCPPEYFREAQERNMNIHQLLTEKAKLLRPGQSGLLALDWWNGNRSILVDPDLTGMILGMTLLTKPEEIYRALIEATAYGARTILENFRKHGVPVGECLACGGISQKNSMAMQIYADVLNVPIRVAESTQTAALGSAIFAAVAAGGYGDVFTAIRAMGRVREEAYQPIPGNAAVYEKLFDQYTALHDYFGRGGNDVMKTLKELRKQ